MKQKLSNAGAHNNMPEQIRKLIKDSGKTNYQIAKEAGITQSTLQRVNKPGWGTQIETAAKVLNVFNCSLIIEEEK